MTNLGRNNNPTTAPGDPGAQGNEEAGTQARNMVSAHFTGPAPFCRLGVHVYSEVLRKEGADRRETLRKNYFREAKSLLWNFNQKRTKATTRELPSSGYCNPILLGNSMVTLKWVSGHAEVQAIVVADTLARKGASIHFIRPEFFCGLADLVHR